MNGQEKREETRHRIVRRHVVARIQRHQRADAEHQHREQPGEPIHAQHEVQPKAGQPHEFFADHATVGDLGVEQGDLNGSDQGHKASQQGFGVTCIVRQQGRQTAADKRQKQ